MEAVKEKALYLDDGLHQLIKEVDALAITPINSNKNICLTDFANKVDQLNREIVQLIENTRSSLEKEKQLIEKRKVALNEIMVQMDIQNTITEDTLENSYTNIAVTSSSSSTTVDTDENASISLTNIKDLIETSFPKLP